ncbi:hypothetical protein SAMN02799631_03169 [Methylobacterium sp. 174MFSha1.1]|uniref:hypothetical protein n=1 Tax=Methylobacterium sp. 174MFSha1.1 TaxID=1502749 RepID=UPI0008E8D4DC|nr:hypothetical protein [Methylobacterium sp. 174MFSha1.1]SFU92585.1 hypothetical protein SAMN02799631_03169 [Methylobacterium sp. 174MFSha1.1]
MSNQGRPGDSPLSVYRSPDPVAVARLVESHGMDAAVGRFYWLSSEGVGKLAQRGREILRGRTGPPIPARGRRRSTTPEQEAHGIAEVLRLGSVHRAARATGISHSLLRTLLVERGIPVPRLSREERVRAVLAGQARAAAASETPATERTAA